MVAKRKRNVGPYQTRRATKKPPTPLQKVQSKGGFRSVNTRRRRERLQEPTIEAKPFVYEQLDATSPDAFRLLTLLPGLDGAPIECSLKADCWSNPRCVYEALSYAWGDPNVTTPILVEGSSFQVTPSLESALTPSRVSSGPPETLGRYCMYPSRWP
jgi:hypothetical protein